MLNEKRRFSRIHTGIEAQLLVDGRIYKTGKVMDLGVGGCLLGITADLKPGTDCSLKCVLGAADAGPELKIDARIVRCEPDTIALKFIRIDPDSLFHLQNLVRYNSQDPETVEHEIEEHPGLI